MGRKNWLFRQLPLETESTVFILVNALDFYVTYLLLRGDGVVESNPVANWVLRSYGFRGLVFFKFALVAFICVLAQVIATKKREAGRRLLHLCTVVVVAVVVYGVYLLLAQGSMV